MTGPKIPSDLEDYIKPFEEGDSERREASYHIRKHLYFPEGDSPDADPDLEPLSEKEPKNGR